MKKVGFNHFFIKVFNKIVVFFQIQLNLIKREKMAILWLLFEMKEIKNQLCKI